MKNCKVCGVELNRAEYCSNCRNALIKRKFMLEIYGERGFKCEMCGGVFHPASLEFHHTSSKIHDSVSNLLARRSWEKIKEDLSGVDRVSIIDPIMMKNIIMSDSPQGKVSGYIFQQLSIRERSPYTTSGAVPDSLFFGRQMEIAIMVEKVTFRDNPTGLIKFII